MERPGEVLNIHVELKMLHYCNSVSQNSCTTITIPMVTDHE